MRCKSAVKIRFLSGVLFSVLMFAQIRCTENSLVDGTSSETTDVIAGIVVTGNGSPAKGAIIHLIDQTKWNERVASDMNVIDQSTIADARGHYSFPAQNGTFSLQIDHKDGGYLLRSVSIDSSTGVKPDTIMLDSYSTLNCRFQDFGSSTASLLLWGTAYQTENSAGTQVLSFRVPSGHYTVMAKSFNGQMSIAGAVDLKRGQPIDTISLAPGYDKIIIDDFEDEDENSTLLGKLTGGYWYTFTDAPAGLTSRVAFSNKDSGVGNTRGMHTEIVLDTSIQAWAGRGISIGAEIFDDWNLQTMTALTFSIRGRGTIRVSVETASVEALQEWPHFGAIVNLDSAWKEVYIPIDSLVMLPYTRAWMQGLKWSDVSDRVNKIEFEASGAFSSGVDTVVFWIDNVAIEGVSIDNLYK